MPITDAVMAHTEPLFARMNILKLEDLFKYNAAVFVHKLNNELLPISFDNFLKPIAKPNRTNGYLHDKLKTKFLSQFPTFYLPIIWNELNLNIKLTISHKTFKKEMYEFLLDKYQF